MLWGEWLQAVNCAKNDAFSIRKAKGMAADSIFYVGNILRHHWAGRVGQKIAGAASSSPLLSGSPRSALPDIISRSFYLPWCRCPSWTSQPEGLSGAHDVDFYLWTRHPRMQLFQLLPLLWHLLKCTLKCRLGKEWASSAWTRGFEGTSTDAFGGRNTKLRTSGFLSVMAAVCKSHLDRRPMQSKHQRK